MKFVLALILATLGSSPALAGGGCDYGSPDVYKFLSWEFKKVDSDWTQISVKLHNMLDRNIVWSEIGVQVNGHIFGFQARELTKAGSDTTVTSKLGMPSKDATEFQTLTPLLCVHAVTDDKDVHTSYLK